jgi:hypothetical protein
MKKVALFVLLVIVATTLMAAIPSKVVRLTIINKSDPVNGTKGDFGVYMKLTGSTVTNAYYYLTVPAGSRDDPSIKVFTIIADVYDRQTWACNGVKSSGNLVASGNIRLTFTPCYEKGCRWLAGYTFSDCNGITYAYSHWKYRAGEPRMEKVTYFKYLSFGYPQWWNVQNYAGYWNIGCYTWYYRSRTWKTPTGCQFAYQY